LPFKLNADCRHHIPKQTFKVANWHDYDASLRQRGNLTVWFTEKAIAAWGAEPRTTRGGLRNPVHRDHCFRLIAITWSTGLRSPDLVIAIALAMAACGPVRLAVLNPG